MVKTIAAAGVGDGDDDGSTTAVRQTAITTSGGGSETREASLDSRELGHFLQIFFFSRCCTIVRTECARFGPLSVHPVTNGGLPTALGRFGLRFPPEFHHVIKNKLRRIDMIDLAASWCTQLRACASRCVPRMPTKVHSTSCGQRRDMTTRPCAQFHLPIVENGHGVVRESDPYEICCRPYPEARCALARVPRAASTVCHPCVLALIGC